MLKINNSNLNKSKILANIVINRNLADIKQKLNYMIKL